MHELTLKQNSDVTNNFKGSDSQLMEWALSHHIKRADNRKWTWEVGVYENTKRRGCREID